MLRLNEMFGTEYTKEHAQTKRVNKNLNVNIMLVDVSAYFIQYNEQDFVVIKCWIMWLMTARDGTQFVLFDKWP